MIICMFIRISLKVNLKIRNLIVTIKMCPVTNFHLLIIMNQLDNRDFKVFVRIIETNLNRKIFYKDTEDSKIKKKIKKSQLTKNKLISKKITIHTMIINKKESIS